MLEYLKAPFQEVDVLVEIAIRDALTLSQNPGFVHALGAALYRLRDADSALAARVGIDFISVREWAAQNLPLLSSAHKPYEGPLDFEYNITLYYENDRFRRVVLRRARSLLVGQPPLYNSSRRMGNLNMKNFRRLILLQGFEC